MNLELSENSPPILGGVARSAGVVRNNRLIFLNQPPRLALRTRHAFLAKEGSLPLNSSRDKTEKRRIDHSTKLSFIAYRVSSALFFILSFSNRRTRYVLMVFMERASSLAISVTVLPEESMHNT